MKNPVTVRELINYLEKYPDNCIVMAMGQDPGGYDVIMGALNNLDEFNGKPYLYYGEN